MFIDASAVVDRKMTEESDVPRGLKSDGVDLGKGLNRFHFIHLYRVQGRVYLRVYLGGGRRNSRHNSSFDRAIYRRCQCIRQRDSFPGSVRGIKRGPSFPL